MTRRRLRWLAGGAALAVAALAAAWQFDPGRIGRRLASALPFGGAAQSCFQGAVHYCLAAQSRSGKIEFPAKTDYWNGVPKLDAEGVPYREGLHGRYRNVSSVAFAAYGPRLFDVAEACRSYTETPAMRANRDWLLAHVVPLKDGAVTWHYDYDTHVNDSVLDAPFASAFSQAAVIERLLLLRCAKGDARFGELARQAARAFDLPVSAGGLRSEDPDFTWFQEVPLPDRHNPHIVNAHLYAIYVLGLMAAEFPDDGFGTLAARGLRSFERALPAIDTGYWNRYDLRPAYSAFSLTIPKSDAVLRSLTLTMDGKTSSIDFASDGREPSANAYRGDFERDRTVGGIRLKGDLAVRLVLPMGREFSAGLVDEPLTIAVRAACCAGVPLLAVPGMRPGIVKSFPLTLVSRRREGGDEVLVFEAGLRDAGWWPLPEEYVPNHADLLAQIARQTNSGALYVYALRWQGFSRRYEEDRAAPPPVPSPRQRYAFAPASDLGERLLKRFDRRHPAEIGEAEIRAALADIYPIAPGTDCSAAPPDGACEARRLAAATLALRAESAIRSP